MDEKILIERTRTDPEIIKGNRRLSDALDAAGVVVGPQRSAICYAAGVLARYCYEVGVRDGKAEKA